MNDYRTVVMSLEIDFFAKEGGVFLQINFVPSLSVLKENASWHLIY